MNKITDNGLFNEIFNQYPIILIDVGARGGIQPPWNDMKTNLEIIGFEPDNEAYNQLKNESKKNDDKSRVKKRYFNTGLYTDKTDMNFYITRRQGHSSIYKPNLNIIRRYSFLERYDIIKTKTIKVYPLDEVLNNTGIYDFDFIKLDTQGSELDILNGGKQTLSKCFGVEVEVEFLLLYKEQSLFSEIEVYLRNLGFELFDIKMHFEKRVKYKDIYQKKGQLTCGDALFLRNYNNFISDISNQNKEIIKAKILKSIVICSLYGLIDYALEITEASFNHKYIKEEEKEKIKKELLLEDFSKNRQNKFIDFIKNFAYEFSNLTRKKYPSAGFDNETLGNIKK